MYLPDVLGVPREQADFPAEQPAPCEDPRFPAAYAHPRRPRHPGCPSSQGPRRALCLTAGATRGAPLAPFRRFRTGGATWRARGTIDRGGSSLPGPWGRRATTGRFCRIQGRGQRRASEQGEAAPARRVFGVPRCATAREPRRREGPPRLVRQRLRPARSGPRVVHQACRLPVGPPIGSRMSATVQADRAVSSSPGWISRSWRIVRQVPLLVLVGLIRAYQSVISPMTGPTCKYYPSCSQYALVAIRRHGVLRGVRLAVWRLLRCNPWSKGGVDDVPEALRKHSH